MAEPLQDISIEEEQITRKLLAASELKLEIAVALYAQGKLSIGKARELADMTLWEFRHVLAARRIPPHLDVVGQQPRYRG